MSPLLLAGEVAVSAAGEGDPWIADAFVCCVCAAPSPGLTARPLPQKGGEVTGAFLRQVSEIQFLGAECHDREVPGGVRADVVQD